MNTMINDYMENELTIESTIAKLCKLGSGASLEIRLDGAREEKCQLARTVHVRVTFECVQNVRSFISHVRTLLNRGKGVAINSLKLVR